MKEIDKLDRLLGKRKRETTKGVVQSVHGGQLVVKTNIGAMISTRAGSEEYKVGDKVTLANGLVVNKVSNSTTGVMVYLV